jgi:hypothetical protein
LRAALTLIVAYVAVGAIYVWRKLNDRNPIRIPFALIKYRAEGGTGRLIDFALSWPLATFINRDFAYWAIFAALAAIGLYFSSI